MIVNFPLGGGATVRHIFLRRLLLRLEGLFHALLDIFAGACGLGHRASVTQLARVSRLTRLLMALMSFTHRDKEHHNS